MATAGKVGSSDDAKAAFTRLISDETKITAAHKALTSAVNDAAK